MRKGLRWNGIWGLWQLVMQRINLYKFLFTSLRHHLTSDFHCGLHLNIDNEYKNPTSIYYEMALFHSRRYS